jgi:predicted nucleic acid-binding protein
MTSRDFNQYSPANILKEIRETHTKAERSANREKKKYSFANAKLEDLYD